MTDQHTDGEGNELHGGEGTSSSRRRFLQVAGLGGFGLAAASLGACGSSTEGAGAAKGGHGSFPATPQFNWVFVNHVTTNSFFQATQYGAEDACSLTGCKYQWTGSETSDVGQMVNAMNSAITSGADGIAVALIDQKAFDAPVKAALAKGIPVISYNADTPNDRLAYVGQDPYVSGQQMGRRIAGLVDSGKVAIFIDTPGSLNVQPRADGALAAIKASGKPIQAVQVTTAADANAEQAVIDSWYQGNHDAKGLFSVDGTGTQGVANVMKKYGLAAKGIHGGGNDLLPISLRAVKSGDLDFCIDQEAYHQGFIPALYLYMYKLSGTLLTPPATDTGLKFVTKANVGPYLGQSNRFEGSAANQLYLKA